MDKRLRRGKDFSLGTQSAGRKLARLLRLSFMSLVWAFVSLACAIGVLDQDDPIFSAPTGGAQWTPTAGVPLPTEDPSSIISTDLTGQNLEASPMPANWADAADFAPAPIDTTPLLYYTQAGETLPVIAAHFDVQPEEIYSPMVLPVESLIPPNTLLIIPRRLANTTSAIKILPDSEVVYSPTTIDFDIEAYIMDAGGYLSNYREWLGTSQWTTGTDIVERVALENSINPRLLLALLEYQSGWVYGWPDNALEEDYPLGNVDLNRVGLYSQLIWAINHLSNGYYGWRDGHLTEIQFSDGVTARLSPDLNAGTVALQYYFAQVYDTLGWVQTLDTTNGIAPLYERLFGSPWVRAMDFEPLFPTDLTQPPMNLPFLIGQVWSYTGGPHGAWEHDGARAALDFAPATTEAGCSESYAWVTAVAAGLVVRNGHGVIVVDLDGDGLEQTGWNILYLHLSDIQVRIGDWVESSDLLGHPSCVGGISTGTHVHIARKYNGEWISADGPLAFTLGGWQAHAGSAVYEGTLTRNGLTIPASIYGIHDSLIIRTRDDP